MSEERKDDESGEGDSNNRSGDEILCDLGIPMQTNGRRDQLSFCHFYHHPCFGVKR